MVVELKGSSVKERHWKQLMKQLRVVWVLSDFTLGQVSHDALQRRSRIHFSLNQCHCSLTAARIFTYEITNIM